MIFANHAHTFPDEIRPNASVDALKKYMDDCGIDKAVAFACFPKLVNWEIDCNKYLYEKIKNDPDLVGFGTIDFQLFHFEDQIEQIAEYGFKGVKIHPQAQDIKIDGDKAFRAYKKCEELGLFVSFHSGIHWNRLANSRVELFDEVAFNFPKLSFSMEHVGGYSYFNEALAVMVNNIRRPDAKIYAGWTTIKDSRGAWALDNEKLYTLLKQTGDDCSIFGLDFPYNNVDYTKEAIERIRSLDISDEVKDKILGQNLANALGITL